MQIAELGESKGKRGSKRVSWREKNPRELMFSIYKPGMSREDLNKQMLLAVQADFGYLPGLVEYFTAYPYSSLATPKPVKTEAQMAAMRAHQDKRVEVIKARVIQLSLNFMVGDKALRDCTGTEAAKAGGWLSTIGNKVGGKRVGDVFKSDAALRTALK